MIIRGLSPFFLDVNGYEGGLASSNSRVGNATSETIQENNAGFSGLDREMGDNLTIFVHGTNSSPVDADPEFIEAVSQTYGEDVVQIEWSGNNTKKARSEGALKLNDLILNHQFEEGEQLNIVMHSHGGNVGNEFTQLYGGDKLIDNYILLATPVRNDYAIDFNNFTLNANIMNVYDNSDLIQVFGGVFFNENGMNLPSSREIFGSILIKNVEIEVKNNVDFTNYLFPLPAVILDESVNDHINIDSQEVWNELYK